MEGGNKLADTEHQESGKFYKFPVETEKRERKKTKLPGN